MRNELVNKQQGCPIQFRTADYFCGAPVEKQVFDRTTDSLACGGVGSDQGAEHVLHRLASGLAGDWKTSTALSEGGQRHNGQDDQRKARVIVETRLQRRQFGRQMNRIALEVEVCDLFLQRAQPVLELTGSPPARNLKPAPRTAQAKPVVFVMRRLHAKVTSPSSDRARSRRSRPSWADENRPPRGRRHPALPRAGRHRPGRQTVLRTRCARESAANGQFPPCRCVPEANSDRTRGPRWSPDHRKAGGRSSNPQNKSDRETGRRSQRIQPATRARWSTLPRYQQPVADGRVPESET